MSKVTLGNPVKEEFLDAVLKAAIHQAKCINGFNETGSKFFRIEVEELLRTYEKSRGFAKQTVS